jgi:hypothetical protein
MPRSVVQSLRLCTMEPLITRMQRYDTVSRVPPTAKLVKNAATSKRSNTGDGVTVKQARLHSRRIDKLVQAKLRGESRRCASQYVVERSSHGRDSRVLFWFGSYDAVIWSLPGRRLCSIRARLEVQHATLGRSSPTGALQQGRRETTLDAARLRRWRRRWRLCKTALIAAWRGVRVSGVECDCGARWLAAFWLGVV